MDPINPNDKKTKRPRIGENRSAAPEETTEGNTFNHRELSDNPQSGSAGNYNQDRPYRQHNSYGQPRQQGTYNQHRPYGNRPQGSYGHDGGYNRQRPYGNRPQGGYQPRPYGNRPQGGYNNPQNVAEGVSKIEGAENTTTPSTQHEGGYNPGYNRQQRPYNNYNQPRPYGNRPQQGGYRQQGGYNNNRQQGTYGQPRPYGNRPQQGGYNNNRPQGAYGQPRPYGNRPQQGGYNNNNRQQGGYNNRPGQHRPMRQNQFGMPHGGKSFVPRPKPVEYEMPLPDPDEQIRLNKYMANAGICSRREADEFIQQGLVKVNGEVVTELGTKITHSDTVEYDEKIVTLERKCYILLNKPKDCVTTSDDPNGRTTVMDIIKGACNERIYPVGRLDRNTTGVLLLTNDGDLASKLTHPKYVKKKIYHVWTDKDISEDDMQRIADGIELEDGPIHADAISYATETDRNQAGIEIHSGRNRIVRRIFESLGYHVTKLDRVYFAGLTKKNLPRGRWRYLTQEEVNFLKMGSFE